MELTATIDAARGGDLRAFDRLVLEYQDMVYAVAYARVGEHHLAQDVSQATFIEVFLALGSLRDPGAFPAWLRRVTISKCHRLFRTRRRAQVPLGLLMEVAAAPADPGERMHDAEMADNLAKSLASLSESDREILTLFYIEDLSVRATAEWVGVSEGAAKKRLHTARTRLKREMIRIMKADLATHRPSRDVTFAEGVRTMLIQLCRAGFEKHFPTGDREARLRWEEESRQLEREAGQSYWEIAWGVVRFMQERDIPFGPGRGRIPLSLIAYLLGVSRINPLAFDLSLAKDPDPTKAFLALDVCYRRMDEVTDYLKAEWPGRVVRFDRWPKERFREFLITPEPFDSYGLAARGEELGLPLIGPDEHAQLSECCLTSVALIGSRTVTHIHSAQEKINTVGGGKPSLDDLDWDDPRVLDLLGRGVLDPTLDLLDWNFLVRRKMFRRIQPKSFEELMAGLALPRHLHDAPGVLDEYVGRRTGQIAWEVPHPAVRAILAPTYGLLLYDEQLASILEATAGWEKWSPKMWDLQKAVYEKNEKALGLHKQAFLAGACANAVEARAAGDIWDMLTSTRAWYCRAAAVGFAVLVFQAAYLKTYFAEAFDAAVAETPLP